MKKPDLDVLQQHSSELNIVYNDVMVFTYNGGAINWHYETNEDGLPPIELGNAMTRNIAYYPINGMHDKLLGSGTFGNVFSYHHKENDIIPVQSAAIKWFEKHDDNFESIEDLFQELAVILYLAKHLLNKDTLDFYKICYRLISPTEGSSFLVYGIVMELYGKDLRKILHDDNSCDFWHRMGNDISQQIFSAVQWLVSHGVYPIDLRPSNILFSQVTNKIKLCDLGCWWIKTNQPLSGPLSLCKRGQIFYNPPEQCDNLVELRQNLSTGQSSKEHIGKLLLEHIIYPHNLNITMIRHEYSNAPVQPEFTQVIDTIKYIGQFENEIVNAVDSPQALNHYYHQVLLHQLAMTLLIVDVMGNHHLGSFVAMQYLIQDARKEVFTPFSQRRNIDKIRKLFLIQPNTISQCDETQHSSANTANYLNTIS